MRPPLHMRIGTKLALFLFFAGLFPMAIFGALYLRNEKIIVEKEIFQALTLLAESKEVQMLNYFNSITSRTIDFSSDGFIRDEVKRLISTGSQESREVLNNHLSINKKPIDERIVGIFILDEHGMVIASTDEKEMNKDESNDEYFQKGRNNVVVLHNDPGDVHFGIVSPFVVGAPITDKDTHKFLGVIVNVFDPKVLEHILSAHFITRENEVLESIVGKNLQTLHVYIVDSYRNVVLHPVWKEIDPVLNKELTTLPVRECVERKKEIVDFYIDHAGVEVFGASMCVNDQGLILIVDVEKEEALFVAQKKQKQFLGIIAALVGFIALVAYLVARILTRPIKALKESAEIVRSGNLHHRSMVIKTGDEIEDLGHAFNAMTASLEERQRVSEEEKKKLSVLLENLPLGVLMVRAPHGEIVALNSRGIELIGDDHMQGNSQWWDRIKKENGERYLTEELPVNIVLAKKSPVTKNDLYILNKKGKLSALRMTAVPIMDDAGTLWFVAVVFDDVTKEKEIDRAKTEFVSLASHQLRTPLSTISWYTEMLLAEDVGKITPDQRSYLQEIYHGNKRMVELVGSLLNVSRIEMGTFAAEAKMINVTEEATVIMKELEPMIKEKKMEIVSDYAPDISAVRADRKMIHILFQNLLSNALKYTPSGGRITLRLREEKEGDGRHVFIEVSDTGYGIPKNQYDKIFTKLFRADNIVSKDTEGTGLGLYLVKLIIDQLKGKIWFVSEEDKGTSFFITLPIEK